MSTLKDNAELFKFGKYTGKKVDDIVKIDPSYCHFLLYQFKGYLPTPLKTKLKAIFPNENSYFINFGPYKGEDILEIKREDPDYIEYLLNDPYVKENCTKLYDKLKSL